MYGVCTGPKTSVLTTPVCGVLSTEHRASEAKRVNAICAIRWTTSTAVAP
jgi:hypothetical protein